VFIGYPFLTDILLLRVAIKPPLVTDISNRFSRLPLENALTSLGEALVLAASHELDIDVREVSVGHRFLTLGGASFADLFLYDTISGGAGYSHMAAERIDKIVSRAQAVLENCICDSSCEKCLRHYANRFRHADLDRHLASEMLRYIREGHLVERLSLSDQVKMLKGLGYMLQLAGWNVHFSDGKSGTPLMATEGSRHIRVGAHPALCASADSDGTVDISFSTFDLKKDLPGTFAATTAGA
jgi:hypothetical protein